MNISKVLKFLVAGIVVGAILFFAGFGVLNLLKDKEPSVAPTAELVPPKPEPAAEPVAQTVPDAVPVNPPEIKITSNQATDAAGQAVEGAVANTNGEGTSQSPIKIKPLGADDTDAASEANEEIQKVAFGTLTLTTVNSINNAPTNADFLIENSENVAIALVKDTASSTLSLPVGDYKITVSQGSQKVVRFLGVKDGQNGSEEFELDVPVLAEEAPEAAIIGSDTAETVTAAPAEDDPVIPAVPVASEEETASTEEASTDDAAVATNEEAATDVTSPEGEEQVSETTETSTPEDDAATTASEAVSAPANASDDTETKPTGGLRLSALTKEGKRPLNVSFYIQHPNGTNIKNFKNVKTQQLILPAGKYQITAKTAKTTLVKQVEVVATRGIHEIFLIPNQSGSAASATSSTSSQNNSSNAAAPTSTDKPAEKDKTPGKLELFAQKASNNSAVKSNFYVQMPNGKLVASKVYVDSIGYKLPPGKYKVIVRATGYKDKTITLNVRAGQTRREVFKLEPSGQSSAPQAAPASPRTAATPANAATTAQSAYGGLTVNVVSANDGAELPADIVVTKRDGTQIKRVTGIASASFDLPPSEFLIRVTYGGLTSSHQVNIRKDQLAIKTISIDTERLSRRERRRLRREREQ